MDIYILYVWISISCMYGYLYPCMYGYLYPVCMDIYISCMYGYLYPICMDIYIQYVWISCMRDITYIPWNKEPIKPSGTEIIVQCYKLN